MAIDRTRPLYRLFEMDDGSQEWWTVDASNMPGDRVGPGPDESVLSLWVACQPWHDDFYAAFEKHRKATIYATARNHDAPTAS